jgi:hypothetical protein
VSLVGEPRDASGAFEQDIAYVAERLRETYNEEGVEIVLSNLRRVRAEAADLRRRIDRTLDYTDSLLRLPEVSSVLADVLRAVHESLCTPARSEGGEPRG